MMSPQNWEYQTLLSTLSPLVTLVPSSESKMCEPIFFGSDVITPLSTLASKVSVGISHQNYSKKYYENRTAGKVYSS